VNRDWTGLVLIIFWQVVMTQHSHRKPQGCNTQHTPGAFASSPRGSR
jgi:hypothetical protein